MRNANGGYAAVDAMVAMLMVSLAIVLSLRAVQTAEHAAIQAQEFRRAEALIRAVMQDGARSFETATGESEGLDWSLDTQTTGAERPIALCRRAVSVESRESSRRYSASSIETCPLTDPS